MPDAFFVTHKSRKRKRMSALKDKSGAAGMTNGKGRPRNGTGSQSNGRTMAKSLGKKKTKHQDKTKRTRALEDDEELTSESGEDEGLGPSKNESVEERADEDEEDELETPAQKRLRLAKMYLESVKEGLAAQEGEIDAAELDKEIIASRLKQDVLEHSGKMHRFVADTIEIPSPPIYLRTRGHRHAVTAAVASASTSASSTSKPSTIVYTAGKEGNIVRTDLITGKQVSTFYRHRRRDGLQDKNTAKGKGKGKAAVADAVDLQIHGHTDEVLALAMSDDGKYLASAGKDRKLIVWDIGKGEWVRSFGGHRDTITALAFRKDSHQVYTASLDRTLKVFDLAPSVMGYVDTLFGHQDGALSLAALRAETAVSAGARDRTVRFWKVAEETQLVFRGGGIGGSGTASRAILDSGIEGLEEQLRDETEGAAEGEGERGRKRKPRYIEGSIDCVSMVDETTFLSGGDSGSICVWTTSKKKPVFSQLLAHGLQEIHSSTEGIIRTPRWITALACLPYGDVIASGSWSQEIRLWKLATPSSPSSSNPETNKLSGNQLNRIEKSKQKSGTGYSLTLIGSLPAPGIVNSLQIVGVPFSGVGSANEWEWVRRRTGLGSQNADGKQDQPNGRKSQAAEGEDRGDTDGGEGERQAPASGRSVKVVAKNQDTDPSYARDALLVIAGLGTEPRLGRWVSTSARNPNEREAPAPGSGARATNGARVFLVRRKAESRARKSIQS